MTSELKRDKWIQPALPNLLNNPDVERKQSPFSLFVFDRIPDYNAILFKDTITEQCRNEERLKILPESSIFSPINFIYPPKYEELMQHLGNRMQMYISALYEGSKSESKNTNVLIESPVSTLAWLIFSNETKIIGDRDLKVSEDLIKLMLFEFHKPRIDKINYVHNIILSQYDIGSILPTHIKDNTGLFLKNYLIFKESIIKACDIAKESGIEINILPNSNDFKN